MPFEVLNPVTSPWSFALWGMDIVGPLPVADAQKKYANIKDKDVSKFVWKNIVCRFRILQVIITDNGPQIDNITFRTFCLELKIKNLYSTPRYPQSNGQTKATNKTLLSTLKKRLENAK